jgi:hypothetical protein
VSAANDVWSDPELRELIREEPELVAIADALAQAGSPGSPTPRRRRLARRSGLVMAAVAVAAVVAVGLVAPWNRSAGGLSGLALAALGKQPVLHAVVRPDSGRQGSTLLELATGRTRAHLWEVEYWYDAQQRRLKIHYLRDGKVVDETLNTATEGLSGGARSKPGGYRLAPDPALTGFLTRYRTALANGRARVTGHTTFAGRRVILLTISRQPARLATVVAIDAESYRPLRFRTVDRKRSQDPAFWLTITTIESVPRQPGQFTPPPVVPRASSGGRAAPARTLTPAQIATALGGSALWPGTTVGGVRLVEATQDTLRSSYPGAVKKPSVIGRGLELVYGTRTSTGRLDYSRPNIRIQQARRPQMAYRFISSQAGALTFSGYPVPRPGWIEISPVNGYNVPRTDAGQERKRTRSWLAQLRRDGLYLTVTASSRKLLLQTIRQLHRTPNS